MSGYDNQLGSEVLGKGYLTKGPPYTARLEVKMNLIGLFGLCRRAASRTSRTLSKLISTSEWSVTNQYERRMTYLHTGIKVVF